MYENRWNKIKPNKATENLNKTNKKYLCRSEEMRK